MNKWVRISICLIFTFAISLTGYSQDSNSAKGYGIVKGVVKVFEKKLFGGVKEKNDKSGVVVYITGFKTDSPKETPEVVMENESFHPLLLPIVAGQSVSFPNRDNIYHNVFSVSPLNSFDLGQYKLTDQPKSVRFDKPGLVPVYCNIHPQMIAFVLVLENSSFAETGKDGKFIIPNVPLGQYTINAWKPKSQRVNTNIEILSGRETVVSLELKEVEKIQPHKRKDGSNYPEDNRREY